MAEVEPRRARNHAGRRRELDWTGLAFATGARARRPNLEGADLPGVCVLRGLKDAREISARLGAAKRIVVVGGGFIGLEVAAAARKKGVRGAWCWRRRTA